MQVSKETGEDRMGEFWVDHGVARVRLAWRRLDTAVNTGCLPITVTLQAVYRHPLWSHSGRRLTSLVFPSTSWVLEKQNSLSAPW